MKRVSMKKWIALCLALLTLVASTGLSFLPGAASVALAAEEASSSAASPEQTGLKSSKTITVTGYSAKSNDSKSAKVSECTLNVGQTLKLKEKSSKEIKWTSSNEDVVAITGKNKAVAKAAGSAVLEGTRGSKKYTVEVKVNAVLKASSKKVSVNVDTQAAVKMKFNLEGYLTFKIKNKKIVSAYWDTDWKKNTIQLHLVGLKKGTTTVTVTNSVTNDKVKIKVTVKDKVAASTKYRAFLVGNSNYYYENRLPNHKWDVTAMKGLLTNSVKTKYTVKTKLDAKASDIISGIKSAFKGAKEGDISLFYYGGHGAAYSGALCGVDNSMVYPYQLRDALLQVPGRVIVILDCCFSGAMVSNDGAQMKSASEFNDGFINALSGYTVNVAAEEGMEESDAAKSNNGELLSPKFIVLTACQAYEESWNWWYIGRNADQSFGTFTRTMFNGLGCKWSSGTWTGSAPCDSNKDGIITLGECAKYVRSHATSLNAEMARKIGQSTYNAQHCASSGSSTFKLFRLKK